MRSRRFVCLSLSLAVSLATTVPAFADTGRPGGILTAKRIVCTAVSSRVCDTDGTCKTDRLPSSELVVDFEAGTYAEGRDRSARGTIKNERVENRVRKFSAAPSDAGNTGAEAAFALDETGALTLTWWERGIRLDVHARCTAM